MSTSTEQRIQAIRDASKLNPETVLDIMPDWNELWSAEKAEHELDGFKFVGPGWYLYKRDTLLVLPSFTPDKFWFYVYDGRNPGIAFGAIATAPVKVDERE